MIEGYEKHRTVFCDNTWGRSMSSSGHLSADMMMMILKLRPVICLYTYYPIVSTLGSDYLVLGFMIYSYI